MRNYLPFIFLQIVLLFGVSKSALSQIKKMDSLEKELQKDNISAEIKFEILLKLGSLAIESDTRNAPDYLNRAEKLAKQIGVSINKGKVYQTYANYYEKVGKFDSALYQLKNAEQYLEDSKKGKELNIFIHLTKGVVLRRQSKYEDATKQFIDAAELAASINDDTLTYATNTQLGINSVTLKDLARAQTYHEKAIEAAKRMKNARKIAKSYGNIGIICREQEKHEEAIKYNLLAVENAIASGDSSTIAYTMAELGTAYDRNNQPDKATSYLTNSIGIRERNNEQNELAYTYFYLGSNLGKKGQILESENWIRKALTQAKKVGNIKQVQDVYQMMYINFERNKKADSSLFYLKKFVKLKDSLSGAEVKNKIQELNIQYETQQKDLALKDEKIKNTYLLAGLGISILSIIAGIGFYNRKKLRFKNQMQEVIIEQQNKSTKAIIEAEENERQRIATDLHDGIGQLMTAAKMNLEALKPNLQFENERDSHAFQNITNLVNDSAVEVRNISHQMMPNALLKNGLGIAVRNFLDNINQQTIKVQLFTDGLNIPFDANTEIFIYRIIQECVNNTIKHANASELNISILKDSKELDVTIEDNGNGFDITSLKNQQGIGLENITKRVQFLKGEVHWDSTIGKGTTVVINIPME